MIGEINPHAYDLQGRVVSLPPHGWVENKLLSCLTGDLAIQCSSLREIQAFLRKCRYVSDPDQFGVEEHWMHPQHFEMARKGDCEDFALWVWRQLLAIGLDARFVLGKHGSSNHAWVTFSESQVHYLFEPTAYRLGKLPYLAILLYEPFVSVSVRDGKLTYRKHRPCAYNPTLSEIFAHLLEYAPLFILSLWHLAKKTARRVPRLISRREIRKSSSLLSEMREDLKWQQIVINVNDLLPGYDDLMKCLLESGIPVSYEFGSSSQRSGVPEKRLVTFGTDIPPDRVRDIINATEGFVDFIQITRNTLSKEKVYIGSYGYRMEDGEPMAELTPALRAALVRVDLSAAALQATVARHAGQGDRAPRSP